MIKALSYIGIKSTLRDEWAAFATKILGMQLIDKGGDTSIFRMDNQAQRLFVSGEQDESIACIGWEVETKASLGAFGSHLEANGVEVFHGSQSLASQRQVADLLWFIDPAGFRVELVWKPEETLEQFVARSSHRGIQDWTAWDGSCSPLRREYRSNGCFLP